MTKLTDTWPPRFTAPAWKTSRTATKKTKVKGRSELKTAETNHKKTAKKRDHYRCRFPLCGCKTLGLALDARLEASHHTHKGMGGDPTGERSLPWLLVSLCKHRHQDGAISIHKGTLRPKFLSTKAYDGPIAWEVDINRLRPDYGSRPQKWLEVARETKVGEWALFTEKQRLVLETLKEMDL